MQRPAKRTYKQDEEQGKNWVELEFPGITDRAKEEGAEICFGDETDYRNAWQRLHRREEVVKSNALRCVKSAQWARKEALCAANVYAARERGGVQALCAKRQLCHQESELKHNVCSHLKPVQLLPGKIQGFFSSPTTSYTS